MDIGDFASQIAKAKALMKSLNGDMKIDTSGLDAAATKVAALSNALKGLNGTVRVNTDGLGAMAAKTAAAGAATAGATALMINGWRLTGTVLHWVIAGGAELLAVTIPALVALAAGVAVMAPAAQSAAAHMQALSTATQASGQMFGQTIGDVLGLGHALQTAQDAAQPAVYGILGSALIAVKGHMGELTTAGTQVSRMFQAFAAKLAVEFGPGGSLGGKTSSLFTHMTADLQGLGQVLGNVGHALINVFSAAPGLAEFLLKGLSGITGFISRLSGAAPILLTVGIAFEELYRYAGGAARILGLVGSGLASILKMAGAAEAASKISGLAKALQDLAKTGVGKFQIAGVAAAAIVVGFLVDKLLTARTAAQAFGDSLQSALMKASNAQAMSVAINNIAALNQKIAQIPGGANQAAFSFHGLGNAAVANKQAFSELTGAMRQQQQEAQNIAQGAALIAKTYGTTLTGAVALADMANVKLAAGITGTGQAAMIARMQIASLVQGYQAMGAPLSAVGSDMTALAIQSGLASSQVGKLNSAWDQFMGNLTGGTSALASLSLDLTSLTTGVNNVTNVLGKTKSISLSVKTFAADLKSFTGDGAQAWQNFARVVGSSAPQLIDWLRTAGAEGAVSGAQFKQGVLDMVSALVPLAADSKTAQAEVLGLVAQVDPSINTWAKLGSAVKSSGASMSGLAGIVGPATQKMADMQSVAQTLGNVLSTALISALQAAQVQASGAGSAMQAYAQALMNGNKAAAAANYGTLIGDLEKLGLSAQQAAALVAQVTQNLNAVPSHVTSTISVYTNYLTTGGGAAAGINPAALPLPHHAAGTPSAAPGWAWVGEAGPELVRFKGGETVLPNSVSMGYANGAGGVEDQHIHLYLDGRELHAAMKRQSGREFATTGRTGMTRRTR